MGKITDLLSESKVVVGNVKSNRAPELELALVMTPSLKDEIAITPNTKLKGFKSFKDIKGTVQLQYRDTARGPEAEWVKPAVSFGEQLTDEEITEASAGAVLKTWSDTLRNVENRVKNLKDYEAKLKRRVESDYAGNKSKLAQIGRDILLLDRELANAIKLLKDEVG